MPKHNCEGCKKFPLCNHVRQDIRHINIKNMYVYAVTYVGDMVVVTGDAEGYEEAVVYQPERAYKTVIVRVDDDSIGNVIDLSFVPEVPYQLYHSYSEACYAHDFIVMGLREKMLSMSE